VDGHADHPLASAFGHRRLTEVSAGGLARERRRVETAERHAPRPQARLEGLAPGRRQAQRELVVAVLGPLGRQREPVGAHRQPGQRGAVGTGPFLAAGVPCIQLFQLDPQHGGL